MSTSTLGSSLGTGGMETKLIAAEIATETGVTTIITSSKHPENIFGILEYHNSLKFASPSPDSHHSSPTFVRPPHTIFEPSAAPLGDLKSWTSHTLFPSGTVVIDAGAHHVLSRRESGGRLLPAGVLQVVGAFASGQAVRIVIRRPTDGVQTEDPEVARASYLNGMATTQAGTPTLLAAASATSTIASLDPLLNSVYPASHLDTTQAPVEDLASIDKPDATAWEEVEVGRGLANYNSAQITKLKCLNRYVCLSRCHDIRSSESYSSYISQLLGYNDSDYVVENISLRIRSHQITDIVSPLD